MLPSSLGAALLLAAAPASAPAAPTPGLSLEEHALLRCSVAIALISARQDQGDAAARRHPPLSERGREFFVRSMARLMDAHGLGRADIARLTAAEAATYQQAPAELEAIMPACLALLDQSER